MIDNIQNALTNVMSKLNGVSFSNKEWTIQTKRSLIDLAKEKYNYRIAAAKFDDCDGERLWDLTWYKQQDDSSALDVSLIAEIEWSLNLHEIKYDFEKLIMGRADLRLMIFPISEYIQSLIEIIENSRLSLPGDKYLFAAIDGKPGDQVFKFKTYTKL